MLHKDLIPPGPLYPPYSCSQACFASHATSCDPLPAPTPAPAPGTSGSPYSSHSAAVPPLSAATTTPTAAAAPASAAAAAAAAAASVPASLRGNTRITSAAASTASSLSLSQFPPHALARLSTHADLRAALRSEELQAILAALAAAPAGAQRRLLADQVEGNARFAEFVHEMLGVVDDERVRQREEEENRKDREFAEAFFGVK